MDGADYSKKHKTVKVSDISSDVRLVNFQQGYYFKNTTCNVYMKAKFNVSII